MFDAGAPVEGPAVYFDGASSRRREASLRLAGALEIREGETLSAKWEFDDLRRADGGPGLLRLRSTAAPELARLEISGAALQAAVVQRCRNLDGPGAAGSGSSRAIIGWSLAAAASIALIAIYGVPAAARALTTLIPRSLEARAGDAVASKIELVLGKTPCDGAPGLAAMAKLSGELAAQGGLPAPVSVTVLRSFVPNAFAIPGDRVFVLSGLIDRAERPDELAGVVAHEFGHVAHRDALREMISSGGTAFFFGLLFGDVSGSGALLLATRGLVTSAHSRDAETAADAFAATVMRGLGRSPAPLGQFLIRLTGQQTGGPIALFASHPLTQDRLAALQRQDQPVTGPPLLNDAEWRSLKAICAVEPKT
jgi:hypothetical protein